MDSWIKIMFVCCQVATLPQDIGGLLSGLATTARNVAGMQSGR